jgi:hypothetical protein
MKRGSVIAGLFLLLWLQANITFAAPARVASLDLTSAELSVAQAASLLAATEPDIILLQGVKDWAASQAIADALPMSFKVLVCSAFESPTPAVPSQVAVLSRHRGLYAWTQQEGTNGAASAYALAIVQLGELRFCVLSSYLRASHGAPVLASQIVAKVNTTLKWTKNRPDAWFLAASAASMENSAVFQSAMPVLNAAGFVQVETLGPNRVGLVRRPGGVVPVQVPESAGENLFVVNLTKRGPVAAAPNAPEPQPKPPLQTSASEAPMAPPLPPSGATEPASIPAPGQSEPRIPLLPPSSNLPTYIWPAGAGAAALLLASAVAISLLNRRKVNKRPLQPQLLTESTYVVVAPDSLTNTVAAPGTSVAVPAAYYLTSAQQRLARVQEKLETREQTYLLQIQQLTNELATAREENRELIRSKIAQVKAEMHSKLSQGPEN